jgi:oligopeptide/dipeptide ABC transporter ATP-binding protein
VSILDVKDLQVIFNTEEGTVRAVNGVDLSIGEGQSIGVVGESGCGKTVTAYSITRLLVSTAKISSGSIRYKSKDGREVDIVSLDPEGDEIRSVRGGEISMIFQEPMSSLSPVHTVFDQISENIYLHQPSLTEQARERCIELLRLVGIDHPEQRVDEYPFQLSGGMRQRVMIAMALSTDPHLLIADEPTTALDVTTQAQVLRLIQEMRDRLGLSLMLITHDLGVVAHMVDRVYVMYLGRVVEEADTITIFDKPTHPYTQGLLASIPKLRGPRGTITSISGTVPDGYSIPDGCPFAPRCSKRISGRCEVAVPKRYQVGENHFVSCHLFEDRG